jgi:CheY-like chemotaxis protein
MLRSSVDLLGNRKIWCAYVGLTQAAGARFHLCCGEYCAVSCCIRFEVGEASIGEQTLAVLGSDRSDVVRLDIDMPAVNGIEPVERSSQPGRSGGDGVRASNLRHSVPRG